MSKESELGIPALLCNACSTRPRYSSWFVVSDKDLILDPSAQKFFATRIKATTITVEGGHDTLIAFPQRVAEAIEAASRGEKQ